MFSKVLVQSGENTYHLEKKQIEHPSVTLEEVIPEFFETYTPGLHVAVICTSNPSDVISEMELQKALKPVPPNGVIKCLTSANEQPKLSPNESLSCARPEKDLSTQIGGALQYIENCICEYIGKKLIDHSASEEINRYRLKEAAKTVRIEEIWMQWEAGVCSNLLSQDIVLPLGYMPSIFILYVLPESCFEVFNHKDTFFPQFIEYVVLGEDLSQFRKKQQEKDQDVIDSFIVSDAHHKILESQEIFIQSETERFQQLSLEEDEYKLLQKIETQQFKDSTKHIHKR